MCTGLVAPLVGAWIEIMTYWEEVYDLLVAPLVGAWIEINFSPARYEAEAVAPLVGAWIEMFYSESGCYSVFGRSSRGSVD